MKKKLTVVLLIVAMLLVCVALVACSQGESPVESIVVTSMPVTKYYVGDSFQLNDAKLTVYYENGTVETVKLDYSMISSFDSNLVGEQILTVRYAGASTQVRVSVTRPPVYSVRIAETNYKREYVVGQSLDLTEVYIDVTYTNDRVERIAVNADMVQGFDSTLPGNKDVVVEYAGFSASFRVAVVPRSVSQIELEIPTKTRYVVGEKVDFAGGRVFIAYNNNTQTYVDTVSLLSDPNFKYFIDDEETDTFTRDGRYYVTLSYYGHTAEFVVTVNEIKATKLEWSTETVGGVEVKKTLKNQPRGSSTTDLSDAEVTVEYNNGTTEKLPLSDDKIAINWGELDLNRLGTYRVSIETGGLKMDYDVDVVEPVEKELVVYPADTLYYQDGPEIDLTEWSYAIVLTNGQEGVSRRYFTKRADGSIDDYGLFVGTFDLSTSSFGDRTFSFRYVSTDRLIVLEESVTVTVHKKILVDVTDFVLPEKSVYTPGEPLDLDGGSFLPVYNDGTIGERVSLTSDMPKNGLDGYTGNVGDVSVTMIYSDMTYGGEVEFAFDILVVKEATSVAFSNNLSVGLKTDYIVGETFDPRGLVVTLYYSDGTRTSVTDFSGEEWTFVGTEFEDVGESVVILYYGYHGEGSSAVFTEIPASVTNDVSSVEFEQGFSDFGEVIEGLELTIPDEAKLVVTRENGDREIVAVERSMINYRSGDLTLGRREVKVSYFDFEIVSSVTVVARSIESVEVRTEPQKLSYVKSDSNLTLDGMVLRVAYDNATVLDVGSFTYVGVSDKKVTYGATVAGRSLTVVMDELDVDFDGAYQRQTVSVLVTDAAARGEGKETSFEIYCFEKLIKELTFGTDTDGEGAIVNVDESEELLFPSDAYIKVTYSDDSYELDYIESATEEIVVLDYDKNTAGLQSVTVSYLLSECSVSVNVRGKVLSDVVVTPASPEYVSVVEGVPLSAEVLSVRLHFVRYDGTEYSPVYYSDVEFSNVTTCTYDHNAEFSFNLVDNGSAYCEEDYSLTYSYCGVTKSASFRVRTYKKKAVSVSMQVLPRAEYLEGESEVSLYTVDGEAGKILVTYNNGVSKRYDLDNNLVSVSPSVFDGSEIEYGSASRRQRITVTFHDGNNQISTEYYVTVKDRAYLVVDYFRDPTDGIYLFRYGADASNRPGFAIQGYAINAAGDLVVTTLATTQAGAYYIDDASGFETYYLDENNVRLDEFPKEVGLYKVIVTYVGDRYNNAMVEDSRYVRIQPKELTIRAVDKSVVYGEGFDELTVSAVDGAPSVYKWTVSDDNGNEGAAALSYPDETVDGIALFSFDVYRDNEAFVFYRSNTGRTIYAGVTPGTTVVGEYELRPVLVSQLSQNYSFKTYRSGNLTVEKKEVSIVAAPVEKVYGTTDPRLNDYTVYDENGAEIGSRGTIYLDDNGYVDSVSGYTLFRQRGEEYEQVGSYPIGQGSSANIANYSVIDYTPAQLTIVKKEITVLGGQIGRRYYGHGPIVGEDYYEYAFSLADGSTLERGDEFDDVFSDLVHYRSGVEAGTVSIALGGESTELPATANAGEYTVSVTCSVRNYAVTIPDFSFTVTPEPVTLFLYSRSVDYLAYASAYWSRQDEWESLRYDETHEYIFDDDAPFTLTFTEGFLLDQGYYPVYDVIKESGYDVGPHRLSLSAESVAANGNFSVTVESDYEAFLTDELSAAFMERLGDISTERDHSYLVILPHRFDFVRASSEVYARKTAVRPQIDIDYGFEMDGAFADFIAEEQEELLSAFRFTLTNNTLSRANYGYYTADGYSGVMNYDYFLNAAGKNFYPSIGGEDLSFVNMLTIYRYAYLGVETAGSVVLTQSFDYEILPKPIDVRIVNEDCSYTGARTTVNGREVPDPIDIEFAPYTLYEGDGLEFGFDIQVKYYNTDEFVTAEMVYHSGDYAVYVTTVGNYNYTMSDLSDRSEDHRATFTVRPITLDVYLPTADENGYVHKTYSGQEVRATKMNWQRVETDPNDENGYFTADNGTFRVVNDSGLASVPSTLHIDALEVKDGALASPLNATALDLDGNVLSPYQYVWSVNDSHVNLSVRFVKRNPDYDGQNDKYVDGEYGFVIDPKVVRLGNMIDFATTSDTKNKPQINYKDYDGQAPAMRNIDKILIDGDVSADKIKNEDRSRLQFTFTRDMDYVPEAFRSVVTEEDMTDAGYFTFKVSYVNASGYSNYVFEPETDYYVIRRIRTDVVLNGNDRDLRKEFDTLPPSAVKSDVSALTTVLDDVFIDVVNRYYRPTANDAWGEYVSSSNDAGQYAYDVKTYAKVAGEDLLVNGDRVYFSDYTDEITGYPLLSWNYCFTIPTVSGVDSNGCDGLFYVDPKAVSIVFENGTDSGANYIFPRTFDRTEVTASEATAALCENYYLTDRSGTRLSEEQLRTFGFVSVAGTTIVDEQVVRDKSADLIAGGNASILSAGSSFAVDFSDLAAMNKNFTFVNKPILYSIVPLTVELILRYQNGSGNAEMTYGTVIMNDGSGIDYRVFDFADKAAFASAIHSDENAVGEASDWISTNDAESSTKFILPNSTARYYLTSGSTRYNLADREIIDAGTYYTDVTGFYSANYTVRIVESAFVVNKKPISVLGAKRDYFDKTNSTAIDWSIDGNVRLSVERALISAVLNCFVDDTPINADAGDYSTDASYYVYANRSEVERILAGYPNYVLDMTDVSPDGSPQIYLKLTVNKLPLVVGLKNPDGSTLSMTYGHVLTSRDYTLTYVGMPALSVGATDYSFDTESAKQNNVKTYVEESLLDMERLATRISGLTVQETPYTDAVYALDRYLKEGASTVLTNFIVTFEDFSFYINKIVLNLTMVNPAQDAYDEHGRFSILYDERNNLVYSETESGRLNYRFSVDHPESIIGYVEGMTMEEMMELVLSGNGYQTYREDVKYVLTKDGETGISAGRCSIRLTDDWYVSANYTLVCAESDIMVYPVVSYIGEDSTYSLPYTAVSLTGVESEYKENILNYSSMLVRFTYEGMPEGQGVQWVDIRRAYDASFYEGSGYARSFTLAFSGEEPASIKEGDVVGLTLTYYESFYSGAGIRENRITTPEFFVRVYAVSDSNVKDRTTANWVDGSDNGSDFSTVLGGTGDRSYYLTETKDSDIRYVGSFDVISTDFILESLDPSDYAFALTLYENDSALAPKVRLVFEGGSDYGYYVELVSSAGTFVGEKIRSYSYLDEFGEEQERSVLSDVNFFDGRRHTVVAYLDKVGSPDLTDLELVYQNEQLVGYKCKVYYTVTFEIDGRYLYRTRYQGGTVTRTVDVGLGDASLIYSYEQFVNFNDISATSVKVFDERDGSVGFTTRNCTAEMLRFTLKKMGVSLTQGGVGNNFVQDIRINPSTENAVLYLAQGQSLDDLVDYFVVNSSDGYDGVKITYTYANATTGAAVGQLSSAGLYKVTASVDRGVDNVLSRAFFVCVVPALDSGVSITGTLVSHTSENVAASVYNDSPVDLYHGTGGMAFTSSYASEITYSRFVFDYALTDDTASTILILKGSNNMKLDLSAVGDSEIYTGISLEINHSVVDEVPQFETVLHIRQNEFYWKKALSSSIDWVGEKNVLIARYDRVNGVIDIRLVRGGTVLFAERVRAGRVMSGLVGGSAISSDNIRNVIGEEGNNGGYSGLYLRKATMKLYELRLTEPRVEEYALKNVSSSGVADETTALNTNASYILTDSRGVPLAAAENSLRLTFRATSGTEGFRVMFHNNTPYFFGGSIDSQGVTGDRGMSLLVSPDGLALSMYKYDVEWVREEITAVDLFDGMEHTLVLTVTGEETVATKEEYRGIAGYVVRLYVDGMGYNGFAPKYNDLHELTDLTGHSGNTDPEARGVYNSEKDEFFLSGNHYVGICVNDTELYVKEMFVY